MSFKVFDQWHLLKQGGVSETAAVDVGLQLYKKALIAIGNKMLCPPIDDSFEQVFARGARA